jgi:hypothetical protein
MEVPCLLLHEKRGWSIVELLADLIAEVGTKFSATGAGPLILGEFDDDRNAWQLLGECLPAATLQGTLRHRWTFDNSVGFLRCCRLIPRLGEESQLVRVEAFAPRAIFLSQQQVHGVFELLDAPLSHVQRICLLADQLVAQGNIVGESRLGIIHGNILDGIT